MRKLHFLLAVPLVVGALYGCNKDEVKNTPANPPVKHENHEKVQPDNNNAAGTAMFDFVHFSLDVDYTAKESYEVEYENENTGVDAEIKDDRKNEKLVGDKAFTKLEPLLKQLTFDATTSDDEVIKQVTSVFNIADDYQTIEVEVEFADGTKKEYKVKK